MEGGHLRRIRIRVFQMPPATRGSTIALVFNRIENSRYQSGSHVRNINMNQEHPIWLPGEKDEREGCTRMRFSKTILPVFRLNKPLCKELEWLKQVCSDLMRYVRDPCSAVSWAGEIVLFKSCRPLGGLALAQKIPA